MKTKIIVFIIFVICVYILYLQRKYSVENMVIYPQCPCNSRKQLYSKQWFNNWLPDGGIWYDPWYWGNSMNAPWGYYYSPWFGGYYARDTPLLLPEFRYVY